MTLQQWRLPALMILSSSISTTQAAETNLSMMMIPHGCTQTIVEPHLHINTRYENPIEPDEYLSELDDAHIFTGIVLAVYGPSNPRQYGDENEAVLQIANRSKGRLYGFASLNTSDWDDNGEMQLAQLSKYLEQSGIVGVKLAPPHTCFALDDDAMLQIARVAASSSAPVMFIHVGSTPFCPEGRLAFSNVCCTARYIDPLYLEPLVQTFANVTWVLVHAGFDFALADTSFVIPRTPRTAFTSNAISMAEKYPNVYLELSAIFASHVNGTLKYFGGDAVVKQILDRSVVSKTMFGGDANHGMPGQNNTRRNLESLNASMIEAGYTTGQVCRVLTGTAHEVFKI